MQPVCFEMDENIYMVMGARCFLSVSNYPYIKYLTDIVFKTTIGQQSKFLSLVYALEVSVDNGEFNFLLK